MFPRNIIYFCEVPREWSKFYYLCFTNFLSEAGGGRRGTSTVVVLCANSFIITNDCHNCFVSKLPDILKYTCSIWINEGNLFFSHILMYLNIIDFAWSCRPYWDDNMQVLETTTCKNWVCYFNTSFPCYLGRSLLHVFPETSCN